MRLSSSPLSGQYFILPNIFTTILPLVNVRPNSHQRLANEHGIQWFRRYHLHDESNMETFLSTGRFDILTALGFPDADLEHLKTCMMWMFWAFAVDDFSDSRVKSQAISEQQNELSSALSDSSGTRAFSDSYAAMLWDILHRMRTTATAGNLSRFKGGLLEQAKAQLQQSLNRNLGTFPTVAEFIPLRRSAFGGNFSAAMVEYAIDLNLPDGMFEHPATVSMSDALIDIMAWANKEFNDGDTQNLVLIIQHHLCCTLQEAVDELVKMIERRMADYLNMKADIPSFGEGDDQEVARYFRVLEEFVRACITWYYLSPREIK
ncbi:terpenoid synthase [Marasmius fiardii PR-910]|nr:terpenoid synthase [Marasmius fiardii PR-910]